MKVNLKSDHLNFHLNYNETLLKLGNHVSRSLILNHLHLLPHHFTR